MSLKILKIAVSESRSMGSNILPDKVSIIKKMVDKKSLE